MGIKAYLIKPSRYTSSRFRIVAEVEVHNLTTIVWYKGRAYIGQPATGDGIREYIEMDAGCVLEIK